MSCRTWSHRFQVEIHMNNIPFRFVLLNFFISNLPILRVDGTKQSSHCAGNPLNQKDLEKFSNLQPLNRFWRVLWCLQLFNSIVPNWNFYKYSLIKLVFQISILLIPFIILRIVCWNPHWLDLCVIRVDS